MSKILNAAVKSYIHWFHKKQKSKKFSFIEQNSYYDFKSSHFYVMCEHKYVWQNLPPNSFNYNTGFNYESYNLQTKKA